MSAFWSHNVWGTHGLLAVVLFLLVGQPASAEGEREAVDFEALLAELREEYPDAMSVSRHGKEFVERLEAYCAAQELSGDAVVPVARARLLLAEVLYATGKRNESLAALRAVAHTAGEGADEQRARALYLLGEYYYLRGWIASRPRKASAQLYWSELLARYPDASWSPWVAASMKNVEIRAAAKAPRFRLPFESPSGAPPVEYSAEGLEGKLVVINFWRTSSREQRTFEQGLARDVQSSLKDYPVLEGHIQVLGVNLDKEAESFRQAVNDWGIPWPQYHDGRGFETSLAQDFGIPRAPYWAVIGPGGELVFLGGEKKKFYAEVTVAMRRLRQKLE